MKTIWRLFAATDGYVDDDTCISVAKSFSGVEHRLEQVRVLNGVTFINDSIGTSPTRTAAGLHALKQKPILIAGGYDKHIPFDELGDEICLHVKKTVSNRCYDRKKSMLQLLSRSILTETCRSRKSMILKTPFLLPPIQHRTEI